MLALAGMLGMARALAQDATLPAVEVVGTTLLPGLDTPIRDVPSNIQIYTDRELDAQHQNNLAEFLEQNPTSITINAAQGNPFQPDVNFRGFTASPLLGTPQGLSVFQDGVRLNEPFGDVVNWDLIPPSAIASIQLVPGANPIYGLNTLGGALAVITKSGRDHPGGALETWGGSFGRKVIEFEQGGAHGKWDYFVTGNLFNDDGWAEHNPSRVRQFFGKTGYQSESTSLDLSLTLADNTLQGTQTLPLSFGDNIRQAYTYPDKTNNKLQFLTLKGSHFVNDKLIVGGNAYYRQYKSTNFSSNVNAQFDADNPLQATNERAVIDQDSYGGGLQLTLLDDLFGRQNQFVFGGSIDAGRTRFTQESQEAVFTADRGTVALDNFESETNADTRTRYYGLFFSDTLRVAERWTLTLSGRYNRAQIRIADASGSAPELNGNHTFSRLNPAIGLNFNPTKQLTAYATYNEGMRAPTAIELTCADPDAPCKLPNNFLSDPPLKMVVARTIEFGWRGKRGASFDWSAAVFQSRLDDDIQFISSQGGGSNAGYFQNVGVTQRRGIELGAGTAWGKLKLVARYTWLDATYESAFSESSPSNSQADAAGQIQVRPGNRIPGIPKHTLKLRLDYAANERWSLGANLLYASAVYARGDENNQDANGKVPSYTVVNLDSRYQLTKGLDLFLRVNNLFDRRYANVGVLGSNVFTGPGRTFDGANAVNEQFRGYGAPRGGWIGLRYRWE
jgi:outer membrane receptor protein involved in Fe transport